MMRTRARVPRVRVATVYRHMQAIQDTFENAADHDAVLHGLMKNVIWNKKQLEKLYANEKGMKRLPRGDKLRCFLATSAFVTLLPAGEGEDPHVVWPTLLAAHGPLHPREQDTLIQLSAINSGTGIHRAHCTIWGHVCAPVPADATRRAAPEPARLTPP